MDKIPIGKCPYCSKPIWLDEGLNNPKSKPKEGDLGICTSCGEIMRIKGTEREKVTLQELLEDLTPDQYKQILKISTYLKARNSLRS